MAGQDGLSRGSAPRLTLRELALTCAISVAAALVTHAPVLRSLDTSLAGGGTDPLQQAWAIAWGGFALVHQPFDFFDANAFWPLENSLAFSDSLAGYAVAGLVGGGPAAAALRYNLLHIGAYALALVGTYLLARELGASRPAALVGGAAFAYAPWRLAHSAQLNILSSGGIPLALFLLVHGWRRRRVAAILAGWGVAAWQLSLGFNLGVQLAYVLLALGLTVGFHVLRGGRPPRAVLSANLLGALLFTGVVVVLAQPYLEVRTSQPEAQRTLFDVATFSPHVWSFVAAPEGNLVWGAATSPVRETLRFASEQTLFPGLVITFLAAFGLGSAAVPRRLRRLLLAVVLVVATLSLGVHLAVGAAQYLFPYRALYEFAPGFDALRTPGRLHTLTSLALALLAAFGADRVRSRRSFGGPRHAPAVVLGVLFAAVVLEGSGTFPVGAIRNAPIAAAVVEEPQLHLPFEGKTDPTYMFWSSAGFPLIVNGGSGFDPIFTHELRMAVKSFPDRASVARLRTLGVRDVLVHLDLIQGTPWAHAAAKPIVGLPIARRRVGAVVVFSIAP